MSTIFWRLLHGFSNCVSNTSDVSIRVVTAIVALFLSCLHGTLAAEDAKTIDFARDVRPILAEKCLSCHSGEEPAGGLRLGEKKSALGQGDSGLTAIVPGRPAESELLRRILAADPDVKMPPQGEKPLSEAEVQMLKSWIAEGASWSTHWAFQPLSQPRLPNVKDESWLRNDIDRFVLARLEQLGVTPSPAADRHTLIKRLYYDLLGLPPPLEAVETFASDRSPQAYENLVARLLASPHFGERWGRHWLDLAHFADSDGYEKDRARPDAYVYRDWVIEAINEDLPFDRFTIEQLAGDLLPGATAKQRIATGFLRQTLTNEEGGVDQEEFRIAACFDRTETMSTVWLGLTIGCVRCHDHKYDPFPHSDYYRLFAFFNNAEELKEPLPVAADNLEELEAQLRPLEAALAARHAELAPRAAEWEAAEHRRILAQCEGPLVEQKLEIVSVQSEATPETRFQIDADRVVVETSGPTVPVAAEPTLTPEKDTYRVVARTPASRVTGFKLYAIADGRLPANGPGRASDGNFVLTGLQALLVSAEGEERPIGLHRVKADYTEPRYAAEATLSDNNGGENGWAIGGKTGAAHWIEFRTREPLQVPNGAQIKFVLSQQHGGHHLLGSFRLALLTGDERGLHLSNEAIANALEMYPEKRVAGIRQQLFDYFVSDVVRDDVSLRLRREIANLHRQHKARLMEVRTMGTPRLPRTTHRFQRGDFLSPREAIEPGVPAVLASFEPRRQPADRLDLARWLVSAENDLTPRVAVNHIWQHLFGYGLVRTPNDVGTRGQPPSHPELLDWLACRFRDEMQWSRKELIRLVVTSAAYRQASHYRPQAESQDPSNALLFRQNRFRMESEQIRDLHLMVAGLLSRKIGGASVFPPMPEDLARLSYANNFSWANSQGEDRYRRGMYTFFKRTIPHPNLMTFDSPDANVACVARTVSNTPLQSLTLLNNEVHVEAAQAFAYRVLQSPSSPSDAARLGLAWRWCVARPPSEGEVAALLRVLEASRSYYAEHTAEAVSFAGQEAAQGVDAAETAAWVATVRVMLNLDEFITRE
jgi:hypothetical protein